MPTLKKGNIVRHWKWGLGVVAEDERGSAVSVDFDGQVYRLSTATPLVRISSKEEQARRESTFRQETDSKGHFLGSHWEPFCDDIDEVIAKMQDVLGSRIINAFSADCLRRHESLAAGVEWPQELIYFSWPSSMFGMRAVFYVNEGQPKLKSFFPHIGYGMQYPVTLKRVVVWLGGVEAQVEAKVGGVPIIFFDCRYGENRNRYQEGTELDFVLSAVAYECGPADEDFIDVAIPPRLWEAMSGTGEPPQKMSLNSASILSPVDEWDRDDYEFRAPVQRVKEVEILGQKAWLVIARVALFDEILEYPYRLPTKSIEGLDLPILVTAKAWKHDSPPKVSQDITGALWMQGYLWR